MLSSGQQGPLLEAPQRYRALERWLKGVSSYDLSWYKDQRILLAGSEVNCHIFVKI